MISQPLSVKLGADITGLQRSMQMAEDAVIGASAGMTAGARQAALEMAAVGTSSKRMGTDAGAAFERLRQAADDAGQGARSALQDVADPRTVARIEREISQIAMAYQEMSRSGTVNFSDLSRAAVAHHAAIARLRAEMAAVAQQEAAANNPRFTATGKLDAARGVLGVRSFHDVEREIAQVEAAYGRLARSGTLSTAELAQANGAHLAAVARLRTEMLGIGKAGEISAGQTANAMRMLPAQMTDVATQLAGGANPLLVLLQQGGQTKDMFGGFGPMFRGLAAAITPAVLGFGALAAVVGTAGLAFVLGRQEHEALMRALQLTGNAAGMTSGRFDEMATRIKTSADVTAGMSREAALAAVNMGLNGTATEGVGRAIAAYGKAAGIATDESAALFKGIGKDALGWAVQMAERTNFLTVGTWAQIKALQEQGRGMEAAAVAAQALTDGLAKNPPQLGYIDTALKAASKSWSEFWTAAKGVGAPETVEEQLAKLQARIAMVQVGRRGTLRTDADREQLGGALRDQQAYAQELQRLQRRQAGVEAEAAATNKAQVAAAQYIDSLHKTTDAQAERTRQVEEYQRAVLALEGTQQAVSAAQQARDLADIYRRTEDQRALAAVQARSELQLEMAKANSAALVRVEESRQAQLDALHAMGAISERQYIAETLQAQEKRLDAEEALVRREVEIEQKRYIPLGDAAARAQQTARLVALNSQVDALADQRRAAQAAAQAKTDAAALEASRQNMQQWASMYTQLQSQTDQLSEQIAASQVALISDPIEAARAQADVTIAKMRRDAARIRKEYTDLIDLMRARGNAAEADAMKVRLDAFDAAALERERMERVKVESEIAKAARDEWERTAKSINEGLTNALMDAFGSGGKGAKALTDELRRQFNSLVLRPVISAILSPVSNAIGSVANSAVGSLIGSATGSAVGSNVGLLTGAAGAGLWGGSAAYGAAIGTTSIGAGSQAAMLAAQTGVFGAEGASLTAAAAGNAATASAMSTLSAAMPWIAGILAVGAIIKSLDNSGTPHMGYSSQYSAASGTGLWSGDGSFTGHVDQRVEVSTLTNAVAQGVGSMLDAAALTFGKTAGYQVSTAFADDTSKDGAWGALRIVLGSSKVLDWMDTKTTRWAPKEFADGDAGQKQYVAAVASSVRQALDAIGMPAWAEKMLNSLGDAPTIEQLSEVVTRINQTETALTALGQALPALAKLSDDAKLAVIGASGGLDALAANVQAYETRILSESEQAALKASRVADAFKRLGLAAPASRMAFKSLVDGIDTSTSAGQAMLAGVLALAGSFADAQDATSGLTGAVKDLGQGIEDEITRIRGLMATPAAMSLSQMQAQFAITTAQARAGDQTAIDALPGLSKTLLDAAAEQATSRAMLTRLQAQTADSLQQTLAIVRGPDFTAAAANAASTTSGTAVTVNGTSVAVPTAGTAAASTSDVIAELRTLRTEVSDLKTELAAFHADSNTGDARLVSNSGNTLRILQSITPDGDAMSVRTAAA